MAKLLCGDVAMEVTDAADPRRLRLREGVPVERFMRDAKITQIYEGSQRSSGS
jgi:alkylation response protein AidB-like acyl-CoA dehydrogenase